METQLQVSCCITSASFAYLRASKYMYINNHDNMMASYIGFSICQIRSTSVSGPSPNL